MRLTKGEDRSVLSVCHVTGQGIDVPDREVILGSRMAYHCRPNPSAPSVMLQNTCIRCHLTSQMVQCTKSPTVAGLTSR